MGTAYPKPWSTCSTRAGPPGWRTTARFTKFYLQRLDLSGGLLWNVASPVAGAMADSQVFQVAAAALALGADVLQGGVFGRDVLTADPAGHLPMQLPGDGVVDLGPGEREAAHALIFGAIRARPRLRLAFDRQAACNCRTWWACGVRGQCCRRIHRIGGGLSPATGLD